MVIAPLGSSSARAIAAATMRVRLSRSAPPADSGWSNQIRPGPWLSEVVTATS
jgi:hypothetical protein